MATRSGLGIIFDNILNGVSQLVGNVAPYGEYSSYSSYVATKESPVVTNPWSIPAHFVSYNPNTSARPGAPRKKAVDIYLAPAQSYNFNTGQYSDPSLHNQTAARLNQQVNEIKANEAGLSQVFQDSARNGTSVLATVDELYWGDVRTNANVGTALDPQDQVKQVGMNMSGRKTILGATPAPTPVEAPVVKKTRRG